MKRQTEVEASAISPPKGVRSMSSSESRKIGQGLISTSYSSSIPMADVEKYYDKILQSKGWTFSGVEPLKDWGRDTGTKQINYRKGKLKADLFIPGKKNSPDAYSYDYAFEVSY